MKRWSMVSLFVVLGLLITSCAAPVVVEKPVVQTVVVEKEVAVEKTIVQTVVVEKEAEGAIPKDARLTVWGYQSFVEGADDFFRRQVQDFTDMTGVPVEVSFIPGDEMSTKFTAALEAPETLPDIVIMDSPFFPMFYDAGALMDITDVVADLNQREGGIFPGVLASVTVEGKQYALPWVADVMATYLRKDKFEEAGFALPTTYDELLEACKAVNQPNEFYCYGLNLNGFGDPEFMLRGLIWSYGGSLTDETGTTATLNSPETVAAFQWLKDMFDIGSFPPDAATGDDYANNLWWQTRQIAYTENSASIYAWMQENDPELLSYSVITDPLAGPAGRYAAVNCFTIAVTTNTKYPDLAKKLFAYLMAPERNMAYVEAAGYAQLPVYLDLVQRPVFQESEERKPIADTMNYSYVQSWPGPPTVATTELNTQKVLAKAVISMFYDGVSPEDAVANAHAKIEEILARHAE